MGKFKVTRGTWTCWSQETKQANFELEDGRVLGIRVMQDDNGEEIYCCLKSKGEEIYKRDNWIDFYKMEWESEELKKEVEKLAWYIFDGYKTDEILDTNEFQDPWV
tara:strand:+ start:295 stop:612 length:318 start_codon:yes stop_codon:yes gene_type:complete